MGRVSLSATGLFRPLVLIFLPSGVALDHSRDCAGAMLHTPVCASLAGIQGRYKPFAYRLLYDGVETTFHKPDNDAF